MMRRDFLKWLLCTCVFAVCIGVLEVRTSFFSYMASVDQFYICYGIWALFIVGVFFVLQSIANTSFLFKTRAVAGLCPALGLLGTALGLGYSFLQMSITGINLSDPSSIEYAMNATIAGIGTSLTTTITGLISAILLETYILVLRSK